MEKHIMSLNEFVQFKKDEAAKKLNEKRRKPISKRVDKINENSDELSKLGIKELKDGLTLEIIKKDYSWLLEKTQFEDAVIGKNDKGIVWYSGVWKRGVWKSGTFKGGTFKGTSVWMGGTWETAATWDGAYYVNKDGKAVVLQKRFNPTQLVKSGKGHELPVDVATSEA